MKRNILIGTVFFVIGAIIFAVAMSLMGWDFMKLSTIPEYEEKSYTADAGDIDIYLEDKNVSVFVGVSPDEKIHVSYMENDWYTYDITEDSVLKLIKKSDRKWYNNIFTIDFTSVRISVLVPSGYTGRLDIKTSNSKIETENISAFNLNLTTTNSKISLKNINITKDVMLSSSNGRIEASRLTVGDTLDFDTSNGNVTLSDVSAFDIIGETTNSAIKLESIKTNSIKAENKNGKITAKNVDSIELIYLKTSNDSIRIEDISTEDRIELISSNGAITGTILGKMSDFSITSSTSNANNNLPAYSEGAFHSEGGKKLDVKTKNAKIDIQFR